jgi:hypothetical protein
MCGNNHDRGIGEGLEETASGRSRGFRVDTEAAIELRLGTLQSCMHNVATHDHRGTLRPNHDTDMTRCVPRPRLNPDAIMEGIVHSDQLGLPSVHDRQQTVFIVRVGRITASQLSYPPVLPLPAREQVAGVWECRHPSTVEKTRIPTDVIGVQMRT